MFLSLLHLLYLSFKNDKSMQLVFASNNPNKIKEIQLLLPETIQVLSLEAIGCFDDIPETANTIEGNAILKANYVTEKFGYACFADDTGLEVDALNGEPGVYSARYAGEQKDSNDNMNKLLAHLEDNSNRKAHFKTVICLNLKGEQRLFTGIINGQITPEKKRKQRIWVRSDFYSGRLYSNFCRVNYRRKIGDQSPWHSGKAVGGFFESLISGEKD